MDSRTPLTAPNLLANSAAAPATIGTISLPMTSAIITITPTGACTFNATGGGIGQEVSLLVTTSGVTSFVLTFGTNFKTQGTLSTGTVTGKTFLVEFICTNGTLWVEAGRTVAM